MLTNWQPVDSQRMLLWASRFGLQEEFMTAINERHFQRGSQGESASDRATLLAAAQEVGLDVAAARAFLDTDELTHEVRVPTPGCSRSTACPRLLTLCCLPAP